MLFFFEAIFEYCQEGQLFKLFCSVREEKLAFFYLASEPSSIMYN